MIDDFEGDLLACCLGKETIITWLRENERKHDDDRLGDDIDESKELASHRF